MKREWPGVTGRAGTQQNHKPEVLTNILQQILNRLLVLQLANRPKHQNKGQQNTFQQNHQQTFTFVYGEFSLFLCCPNTVLVLWLGLTQ